MTWTTSLLALRSLPLSMDQDSENRYLSPSEFVKTLDHVASRLDRDLDVITQTCSKLFHPDETMTGQTKSCVDMLRNWALTWDAPSLCALSITALNVLGVKDEEYARLVLLSSVLGEIENTLPYHSNMHYRKVLLQLIRLVVHHNEIYAGTGKVFSDRDICLLLSAACIHDVGHDGRGNTVEGVHERARLETRSFDILEHWMTPLGFNDPAVSEALKTMLVATDVSPVGDPRSPMAQMKAAYRHHFLERKTGLEPLNLSPDLRPLERNPALSMMALILQEADIATSAGLDYSVTKYETGLICKEYAIDKALPQHVINFLSDVCGRHFLSDAGQRLYAANMARIFALAQKDVEAGNAAYPDSDHAELLVGAGFAESDISTTRH